MYAVNYNNLANLEGGMCRYHLSAEFIESRQADGAFPASTELTVANANECATLCVNEPGCISFSFGECTSGCPVNCRLSIHTRDEPDAGFKMEEFAGFRYHERRIPGCTDDGYFEYHLLAPRFPNVDDGSCATAKVFGCQDPNYEIYNLAANWPTPADASQCHGPLANLGCGASKFRDCANQCLRDFSDVCNGAGLLSGQHQCSAWYRDKTCNGVDGPGPNYNCVMLEFDGGDCRKPCDSLDCGAHGTCSDPICSCEGLPAGDAKENCQGCTGDHCVGLGVCTAECVCSGGYSGPACQVAPEGTYAPACEEVTCGAPPGPCAACEAECAGPIGPTETAEQRRGREATCAVRVALTFDQAMSSVDARPAAFKYDLSAELASWLRVPFSRVRVAGLEPGCAPGADLLTVTPAGPDSCATGLVVVAHIDFVPAIISADPSPMELGRQLRRLVSCTGISCTRPVAPPEGSLNTLMATMDFANARGVLLKFPDVHIDPPPDPPDPLPCEGQLPCPRLTPRRHRLRLPRAAPKVSDAPGVQWAAVPSLCVRVVNGEGKGTVDTVMGTDDFVVDIGDCPESRDPGFSHEVVFVHYEQGDRRVDGGGIVKKATAQVVMLYTCCTDLDSEACAGGTDTCVDTGVTEADLCKCSFEPRPIALGGVADKTPLFSVPRPPSPPPPPPSERRVIKEGKVNVFWLLLSIPMTLGMIYGVRWYKWAFEHRKAIHQSEASGLPNTGREDQGELELATPPPRGFVSTDPSPKQTFSASPVGPPPGITGMELMRWKKENAIPPPPREQTQRQRGTADFATEMQQQWVADAGPPPPPPRPVGESSHASYTARSERTSAFAPQAMSVRTETALSRARAAMAGSQREGAGAPPPSLRPLGNVGQGQSMQL
jgi:hypothetical protein